MGQAEVFQSVVPDGVEEKRFSLEAQEGGVRSSETESNFRECSAFPVPYEHWYWRCWLSRTVWTLKSYDCAFLFVSMQCFYSDTAETDMLQLPPISQNCASIFPYKPAACSISIWMVDA